MADGLTLDTDLYIPTGVEATPERVAEFLQDGDIQPAHVALLAQAQRPTVEILDAKLAERAKADGKPLTVKQVQSARTALLGAVKLDTDAQKATKSDPKVDPVKPVKG